jgi:hypothetical protein
VDEWTNFVTCERNQRRTPIQKSRQILAQKHSGRVQVRMSLVVQDNVFRETSFGTFIDADFYPRAFACGTIRILPSFFGCSRNGM